MHGQSRDCRCQKFAIAGKTVESQSRGGDMSRPMPCEDRRTRGRSSTSIDASDWYLKTFDVTKIVLLDTFLITAGYKLQCCEH